MTQTVGAMSWEDAKIEISVDAAFLYALDISGSTNKVSVSGGEISTEKAFTTGSMTPMVAYGAGGEMKIDVGAYYTEIATEAFLHVDALYRARQDCWLRITPKSPSGLYRFLSSVGRITSPPPISGEAGSAKFVEGSFSFVCSTLTPTLITP